MGKDGDQNPHAGRSVPIEGHDPSHPEPGAALTQALETTVDRLDDAFSLQNTRSGSAGQEIVFPVRSLLASAIPTGVSPDVGQSQQDPQSSESTDDQGQTTAPKPVAVQDALSPAVDELSPRDSDQQAAILPESSLRTAAVPGDGELGHNFVTARFQHLVTEKGHAVITGEDTSSFQYCEDEPIHIPGAVQSFGVLLALHQESDQKLVVRVVSENSKAILGYSPSELFALNSFTDLLHGEQAEFFWDYVETVRDQTWDPQVDGPEVFILPIPQPDSQLKRFWCAVHVNTANRDLVLCEFEAEDDRLNPQNVSGEAAPLIPVDTLGLESTPDEIAASTVNLSRPLRILRQARKRQGEAAAMEAFSIMSQIQEQLGRAEGTEDLLNTAIGLFKELTGFHRVMVYQFDAQWNGMVTAELVDPRTTKDLYKGHRFPASDIPKQARDLYKLNKVRLLYDRDLVTARLVCRSVEDLATPLDMTHSYLRAMSPIHIKYLANMGVRASMSISINAFDDLWGLISLHSYGDLGMRVSFLLRKLCRLMGDTVARNIERLFYASRLQARKLINAVPTATNPSGYIAASSEDLLKLFSSDYGALSVGGKAQILGTPDHPQEILAIVEYLRMRKINYVLTSQNITKDFPDLRYPPGFKAIAGLLHVPLSTTGDDFMVFLRRPQLMEVKWGGNPYEKKYSKWHRCLPGTSQELSDME
jgi:light-regulated signal transduction histidine kinase (bacteriophytochrome)